MKREHGTRNVALATRGGGGAQNGVDRRARAIHSSSRECDDSNHYFEIELAPNADPQVLLRRLVEAGAAIERFELVQPSLHQIFLERVGATGVEAGMSGHG